MKEFDLQKAKAGVPICTRDGREARIICFDRIGYCQIVALIKGKGYGRESVRSYREDGKSVEDDENWNLMMADIPTTHHEGWINVRYNVSGRDMICYVIYQSKDAALLQCPDGYHPIKISWEDEV